jgi:hypothetical protein
MKNKRIIDSWSKIKPDSAADARMLNAILARNRSRKTVRERVYTVNRAHNWKRLAPIAVCLVLAIAMAIPFLNRGGGDFDLKLSNGVKVNYVNNPPAIANKADLVWLTEDELFAANILGYEIVAFEGTVKEVCNIACDYNGRKDYRAIATIDISEVLRGRLEAGNTVTVLLPAPVGTNLQVEDTGVSSLITAGTTGIFLPIKYDESSIREEIFYRTDWPWFSLDRHRLYCPGLPDVRFDGWQNGEPAGHGGLLCMSGGGNWRCRDAFCKTCMAFAGGRALPLCTTVFAFVCTAASLFIPSLAVIISAGALLNIAIGVLSGCYLTRLATDIPQQRRGIVFGSAYAFGSLGTWLLSLPMGGRFLWHGQLLRHSRAGSTVAVAPEAALAASGNGRRRVLACRFLIRKAFGLPQR